MTRNSRPIGEDDLHGFVDGHLDPDRHHQVERYLAENPAVAARVAGWQAGRASLRAAMIQLGQQPIPARLELHRLAAIRAARRWSTPAVAASMAATLVLGAAIGWGVHQPDRPWSVERVAQEAVTTHRLFVPGLAQDVGWADPALTTRLAAPDLTAAGYTLQQRQVVATNEGVGSSFLYKNDNGNWISVFVRPMLREDAAFPMRPVDGAPGWAWAKGGLGVSLISSTPSADLHGLANQVRHLLPS